MSTLQIIVSVISALLFLYLIYALLKAEKF